MEKELKTLKDLIPQEDIDDGFAYVDIDYLRQEAIKWVNDCCPWYGDGIIDNCRACKRFIKFFNLTEEDLK